MRSPVFRIQQCGNFFLSENRSTDMKVTLRLGEAYVTFQYLTSRRIRLTLGER